MSSIHPQAQGHSGEREPPEPSSLRGSGSNFLLLAAAAAEGSSSFFPLNKRAKRREALSLTRLCLLQII